MSTFYTSSPVPTKVLYRLDMFHIRS